MPSARNDHSCCCILVRLSLQQLMWEALQFDFMQHALLAIVLGSIACGLLGSIVIVNRMTFLAGGMFHFAYGEVNWGVSLVGRYFPPPWLLRSVEPSSWRSGLNKTGRIPIVWLVCSGQQEWLLAYL